MDDQASISKGEGTVHQHLGTFLCCFATFNLALQGQSSKTPNFALACRENGEARSLDSCISGVKRAVRDGSGSTLSLNNELERTRKAGSPVCMGVGRLKECRVAMEGICTTVTRTVFLSVQSRSLPSALCTQHRKMRMNTESPRRKLQKKKAHHHLSEILLPLVTLLLIVRARWI